MNRCVLVALPLLTALLHPSLASAQTLVRQPYLQQGTPNSIVIVWRTNVATDSRVQYGTAPDSLTQTASNPAQVTQHEVTITGLTPGTRYYYNVGTTSTVLAGDATHYFETSPTPGTKKKTRLWVVGDSGTGGTRQAQVRDAMLAAVGSDRPHLYLHMGDMAYNDGTDSEFTDNFFAPYASVMRNTVVWPTLGNHEGHSSDSGTQSGPYYQAYVLPTGGQAGGVPSGTEAYYSFDYANVHFIVLDSYDSPRNVGGAMLTWLQSDLAATQQDWIVAYWHHPAYTKGSHNSDTEGALIDMRENALPILEAAGVDLVLAGHSHIYERSYLIDGAYGTPTTATGHILDNGDGKPGGTGPYRKQTGQNAHNGAVYVVAGHGGTGVSGAGNHPVMYFSEVAHGSCILDVQENRLSLLNIRYDGVQTDQFTILKGDGLVVDAPNGGETYNPGDNVTIRWATVGAVSNVNLELSTDGGANWSAIASNVQNTGQYAWTVPTVSSTRALVRVVNAANPTMRDESNGTFRIQGGGGGGTVIPYGATWAYHDQDVDHGTAWLGAGFNDSAWATGPAQLGYGEGDEATVLNDEIINIPSYYFRKSITLAAPVEAATLKVIHDDGVIVWINGQEVFSRYAGNGTGHAAYADSTADDNELSTTTLDLTINPFTLGSNVVAVMVKQVSVSSSDLSFDLELQVTLGTPPAPDAGVADASAPRPDAATPAPDGGTPRPDAAVTPDASPTPPRDAGARSDAAPTRTDAAMGRDVLTDGPGDDAGNVVVEKDGGITGAGGDEAPGEGTSAGNCACATTSRWPAGAVWSLALLVRRSRRASRTPSAASSAAPAP
ncbi:MAG: metallophosphoesterase [Myxococcota bacterium]